MALLTGLHWAEPELHRQRQRQCCCCCCYRCQTTLVQTFCDGVHQRFTRFGLHALLKTQTCHMTPASATHLQLSEQKLNCRSKRGWQQKVFLSASSERGTRGTRRSEELKDRRPAQGRPSLLVVRRTLRVRPPGGVWFHQRVLVQARSENLLPMAVKYLGL